MLGNASPLGPPPEVLSRIDILGANKLINVIYPYIVVPNINTSSLLEFPMTPP